jgi:radical SAM superfamily enzyme YgiQ (UPF0313 family)
MRKVGGGVNLLIIPPDVAQFWGWSPPPLNALYLAAQDSTGETVIFDGTMDGDPVPFIKRNRPRLVGVTVYTSARHDALRILRAAHDYGCVTVAGGPHVTAPEVALQWVREYPFVDYIVRGDGEIAWQLLAQGFRSDRRIVYMPVPHLDALKQPDWSMLDPLRYKARDEGVHFGLDLSTVPRVSIVTSRGCVGRCRYCAAWRNIGYRAHSPEWMRPQLEQLARLGVRHICIDDDCFGADQQQALDIAAMLFELGFVWSATTRADCLSESMVYALRTHHCWRLSIGIESGSRTILEAMNKTNDLREVMQLRQWCRDAGMHFSALFMEGYPGETDQTRAEDRAFRDALAPDSAGSLGLTLVLPGTDLWREQAREQGVTVDYWLGAERHLVAR